MSSSGEGAHRALIGHRDDAGLVEHAQAVLHGAHGHIELGGQARGFHPPMHGAEQDGADIAGQLAEAGQHDASRAASTAMIDVAMQDEADRERHDDEQHLDGDEPVEAEIAGAHPHHDGDGQRGAGEFGKRILDDAPC